jgi:hypothetical protein
MRFSWGKKQFARAPKRWCIAADTSKRFSFDNSFFGFFTARKTAFFMKKTEDLLPEAPPCSNQDRSKGATKHSKTVWFNPPVCHTSTYPACHNRKQTHSCDCADRIGYQINHGRAAGWKRQCRKNPKEMGTSRQTMQCANAKCGMSVEVRLMTFMREFVAMNVDVRFALMLVRMNVQPPG